MVWQPLNTRLNTLFQIPSVTEEISWLSSVNVENLTDMVDVTW